jgi:hypothetical protein
VKKKPPEPPRVFQVSRDAAEGFTGFDREKLRQLLVDIEGPRASAWLVFKHRRTIHATGRMLHHFDGPRDAAPKWFRTAMEFLAKRDFLWQVTVTDRPGGGTQWSVFWKGWLSNGPKHRDELQRRDRNRRKRARSLRS